MASIFLYLLLTEFCDLLEYIEQSMHILFGHTSLSFFSTADYQFYQKALALSNGLNYASQVQNS